MNPSTSAARTLVRELPRLGIRHIVVAPGSRSAPLAHALAGADGRSDFRLHVRIDERVAAFTALGLARGGDAPVVVVTTSGTAAANLHPAVLEAAHGGVPMIVLTADRPHEMRGTGANQTTDQVRLFGSAPRFFADVPAPHGRDGEDADLRNLLARAVSAAVGHRSGAAGPVHLNLAFREPLVPGDEQVDVLGDHLDGHPDDHGSGQGESLGRIHVDVLGRGDPAVLEPGPSTVVIAGDRAGGQARAVAEAGGYPLLAEPSSGARGGDHAIGPYRLLLDAPELGARIERVIVFGHPTLSRPVASLMARPDVEVVVVAGQTPEWPDAGRRADRVVSSVAAGSGNGDRSWLSSWQQAGRAAQQAVDAVLAAEPLTGPAVAACVWEAQRPSDMLVVGSSNPIRDLDLVAASSADETASVLANRGLSGIDGTVSTAAGAALGSGAATRVLLGDLAFLHDAGGMLVGPLEEHPDLQIVVVNDDGGGIFSLLEHGDAAYTAGFERVFGTPHGADLASLSAGYGVPHRRVDDVAELRDVLASPPRGRGVVEVRTDRGALRELHRKLRTAVDSALSSE